MIAVIVYDVNISFRRKRKIGYFPFYLPLFSVNI